MRADFLAIKPSRDVNPFCPRWGKMTHFLNFLFVFQFCTFYGFYIFMFNKWFLYLVFHLFIILYFVFHRFFILFLFLWAIFRFFARFAPRFCLWMWYFLLNTCQGLWSLETRGLYNLAKDYGHLKQDIMRSMSRKQLVCSSSYTRGPLSNLYHDGPTLNLRIMPEYKTSEQAT